MHIESVKIKNFLSIGEIEVAFPKQGMLLVEGWNDDTKSGNGAGKSSVLSGISWCLFGKIPRGVTSASITRSGEKHTSVSLRINAGGSTILLQRTRSPNELSYYTEEGGASKQIDQQQLDKLLGISYERFLQIAYFAQGLGQRFLDLSDTDKKQLFLDLSNSADYAVAKQIVDTKLKALEKSKAAFDKSLIQATAGLEALSAESVDIDALNVSLQQFETQLRKQKSHMSKLEADNTPPDLSRHKDLLYRLKNQMSKIQESKGELRQLHIQLKNNNAAIEQPTQMSCPHCAGSVAIADDQVVACDTQAIDDAFQKLLEKQKTRAEALRLKITTVDLLVSKEEKTINATADCEQEMRDLSESYRKQSDDIRALQVSIDKTNSSIAILNTEISRANATAARVSKLQDEISVLSDSISNLSIQIITMEEASSVLGPSGIQAYVLDSIIDQFNEYVQETLSEAWPSMRYELLSFKENKTGAISTRFSDSLSIDDRVSTVGALSGGELRCLSIAIDLAVSRIYSLYSGQTIAPLILDEPFEGMDSVNRELAISILQTISNTTPVVVVDHANEVKGLFDSVILIEKKNGVSAIRVE